MYFPSKKDFWMTVLIWGTMLVCFLPAMFSQDFIAFLIFIPVLFLLVWIWFSTGYFIENSMLLIRSGPLRKKVNIRGIKKIRRTRTLLSSPALSFDRLEITHGRFGDHLVISPVRKQEFIKQLLKENDQIELDAKVKSLLESED